MELFKKRSEANVIRFGERNASSKINLFLGCIMLAELTGVHFDGDQGQASKVFILLWLNSC